MNLDLFMLLFRNATNSTFVGNNTIVVCIEPGLIKCLVNLMYVYLLIDR